MQSAPASTRKPLCLFRIWRAVFKIKSCGLVPARDAREHWAGPLVGQVVSSGCFSEVGGAAKILFLIISALYLAHAHSLGMIIGLLLKTGFVRPSGKCQTLHI